MSVVFIDHLLMTDHPYYRGPFSIIGTGAPFSNNGGGAFIRPTQRPAAGKVVTLMVADTGEVLDKKATSALGEYRFDNLKLDRYQVVLTDPDGLFASVISKPFYPSHCLHRFNQIMRVRVGIEPSIAEYPAEQTGVNPFIRPRLLNEIAIMQKPIVEADAVMRPRILPAAMVQRLTSSAINAAIRVRISPLSIIITR